MILSFDVGITNLAYCLIETTSHKIKKWDVCKIPSNNMKQLIGFLDSLNFDSTAIDLVLVEKQPSRNCKMRIIEHILLTFFLVKKFNNVLSFNPKLKLGSLGKSVKGKQNYSTRKKYGIIMTNRFLLDYPQSSEIKNTFNTNSKKDDLSDSLLQALSYCNPSLVESLQQCIMTI